MFYNISNIKEIDLSKFDSSNVVNTGGMFQYCNSLDSINFKNFATPKVITMHQMFDNCTKLKLLDISNFNTSKVTNMNGLFQKCESLISLNLSNFNTSNVVNMGNMFYYCRNLKILDISSFNTYKVTNMQNTFEYCNSLKSLNLSHFNTSNVFNMGNMFYYCRNLEFLDISSFNTSDVRSMYGLFGYCESLKSLNLSNFNTSNVIDMQSMFYYCINLEFLDISSFNTSNVQYMISMFNNCKKLKSLDITNFNTSHVTNMYHIFENCNSLTSLNLTNFDTRLVVDLGNIFYNCYSLTSIDLSNFITISDHFTDYMFYNCSVKSLDLSSFDTSLVTLMNHMFYNCTNLEKLNLSNFDTHLVNFMDYMFYNCKNLQYLNMKKAIEFSGLYFYNFMFDNVPENIVYCLNEANAPKINSLLKNKSCSVYYCLDNWKEKQKKMLLVNDKYICEISILETTNLISFENTELISYNINNSNDETNFIDQNTENMNNSTDFEISTIIENNSNDLISSTQNNEFIEYCNESNFFHGKCNDCIINISYIKDNLTLDILSEYINDFINKISNNDIYNFSVNHYININMNFSITIFTIWYCTNLLLEYDYFEINPNVIFNKLNNNFNNKNDYIFVYTNMKNKNYIEIYDRYGKNKINISLLYNNYLQEKDLIVRNNYTSEISSELGKVITYKIIDNNIDPFNDKHQIFNDICTNFTIRGIDIPLKERKEIIFLGHKEKEIICNDINCNIEKYYLSNFTGICKCKILNNFDYILSDDYNETNKMTYAEYQNFINEKSKINSFLIFKCGKEAFKSNNIKNNPGFYISIVFLIIQLILYIILIKIYLKSKNNIKLNPPKILKFKIDDDSEEDDSNSNNQRKDKNDSDKENKIIIYKNKELNPLNNDNNEKKSDKNNNVLQSINSIEANIDKEKQKQLDIYQNKININMETNNDEKDILQTNGNISHQKEEKQINNDNNIMNNIYVKKKKRSLKNLPPIQKNMTTSKNIIENPKKNSIKEENNISPIIKSSKSIMEYYWKYLSFEQPIINLFEFIKCLKIENSYTPLVVKLMRIIFILSLNIFFNIFHLEQIYFREKYNYFNDKYNIRYNYSNKNISLNERFNYGFRNAIISGSISFVVCLIIQLILNYFFFNIKDKINKIKNITIKHNSSNKKSINNKNNKEIEASDTINNNKIINMIKSKNKKFLIFFGIILLIMIFVFYPFITFNEVYRGGITDLVPGIFWTFIFLQIIPFFYCIILAIINYIKFKYN